MEHIFYVLAAYIFFCKLWPYFLYPNYFRKSKVEDYSELKELASKLKDADKYQQNRLFKSILVNTYMFSEDEIEIKKRLLFSIVIHQWFSFKLNGKVVTVDPYYGTFEGV